jgi:hypothetical protein
MSLPAAEKVFALLHAVTAEEVQDMPPAIRKQLAAQCRRVANIAEPPVATLPRKPHKSGVLYLLNNGDRSP